MVLVEFVQVQQECCGFFRAAHSEVIADILEFISAASNEEKLCAIPGKKFGRFMGNGRSCPCYQYFHVKALPILEIEFCLLLHADRSWRRSEGQCTAQTLSTLGKRPGSCPRSC